VRFFVFFIKKHNSLIRYPLNNRTFEHSQKTENYCNNAVLVRETMLRKCRKSKIYEKKWGNRDKISEKEPLHGVETENCKIHFLIYHLNLQVLSCFLNKNVIRNWLVARRFRKLVFLNFSVCELKLTLCWRNFHVFPKKSTFFEKITHFAKTP